MQLFALDYDTQIGTFFYKFSGSTATLVGCTNLNYWNSAYELPYEDRNGIYKTADVVIPEKVTYNSKEYTVTVIGNDALSYSTSCGYIHSIVLPNTIILVKTHSHGSIIAFQSIFHLI